MEKQTKIIALVGMTGSGKSVASDALVEAGCVYVRFGQLTINTIKERGQIVTPENEKLVREEIRRTHGMGAFATLNIPTFDKGLSQGNVVADGLYSWTEYKILKEYYKNRLAVIAIFASPVTRYNRLILRITDPNDTAIKNRPFTLEQAKARDIAEIENIEKGGPIAMADFTLVNENITAKELGNKVQALFNNIIST